jgi:hypothetical protein
MEHAPETLCGQSNSLVSVSSQSKESPGGIVGVVREIEHVNGTVKEQVPVLKWQVIELQHAGFTTDVPSPEARKQ